MNAFCPDDLDMAMLTNAALAIPNKDYGKSIHEHYLDCLVNHRAQIANGTHDGEEVPDLQVKLAKIVDAFNSSVWCPTFCDVVCEGCNLIYMKLPEDGVCPVCHCHCWEDYGNIWI